MFKTIKTIPLRLKRTVRRLVVRGEIYMPRSSFMKLNEAQDLKGLQTFANPRNAAAGSLRQLDPKIAAQRHLDIFVFNLQEISADAPELRTHSESLEYLKEQGFRVSSMYRVCNTPEEVWSAVQKIGADRESLEIRDRRRSDKNKFVFTARAARRNLKVPQMGYCLQIPSGKRNLHV